MVKTILFTFFGAVIVALLVYVFIGLVSPVEYSAEIEAELNIPKRFIWKYLTEIDSLPSKREDIRRVEHLGLNSLNLEKWREFTDSRGFIDHEFLEKVPERRVTLKMTNSSFAMSGIWIYEIKEKDGNSILTIKERSKTRRIIPRATMTIAGRDTYLESQVRILKEIYKRETTK